MNSAHNLVSVVIPVFNGGHLLSIALASVKAQGYQDIEVIAVDDGSTDGSRDLLAAFSKSCARPVRVLTHPREQNLGLAASLRLALKHCNGDYVAFLEQDDIWPANKISEQIAVFERFPGVGVVFADVYPCDADGRVSTEAFRTLINRPPSERPFNAFWRMFWGNCISTFSNTMVRSKHLRANDLTDSPDGFEDWILLIQLSTRCKFYHCTRTRTFWRQHRNSYHAGIRRQPRYKSRRKFALRNAVDKMMSESRSALERRPYAEALTKGFWTGAISVFNNAERIADYLNRRLSGNDPGRIARNSASDRMLMGSRGRQL